MKSSNYSKCLSVIFFHDYHVKLNSWAEIINVRERKEFLLPRKLSWQLLGDCVLQPGRSGVESPLRRFLHPSSDLLSGKPCACLDITSTPSQCKSSSNRLNVCAFLGLRGRDTSVHASGAPPFIISNLKTHLIALFIRFHLQMARFRQSGSLMIVKISTCSVCRFL